ncbi:MAG: phosphoglycolate phosphatase [Betaproteobacteria bacterium]|nr:phosphoglycolate phosphatase [Betaproteobacteria bacterium]
MLDLDGTLLDTAPDLADAANAMLAGLGLKPLAAGVVRGFIGRGIPYLVERCLAEAGLPLACAQLEPALRSFGDHYRAFNGRSSRPFPGVLEGLEHMRQAGLKLACITNKAQAFTMPLLAACGVASLLDAVVTADQVGRRKPDPAICLHACRQLQVGPGDAVVIGDSANDAESGRAAGCRVVLVTYGYGEGRDVRELGADGVVDSFAAAVKWAAA